MNSKNIQLSTFPDSKKHYNILDGLRGVAAITVVAFHILEAFSVGNHLEQMINHGYLAVDFFFVLSGFVIGYAYDDRWDKMSLKTFFKRRLIRLHPMVIVGMVIGAITFYLGASPNLFPLIDQVPIWKMLLVMLVGFTLFPLSTSMDIRGWGEMHPLNGPSWTLFYEYVANIFYGLFIRKFSNKALFVLVFISGVILIHLAVTSPHGDVFGGWSLKPTQLRIGITRMMYPFFAGLLLSRVIKPTQIKQAFLWSSLLLILILAIPRIGGTEHFWMNGLYDSLSIIFLFPLIVYLGASGEVQGKFESRVCKFFGDISYPLYITHYPLIYIFTAWVIDNNVPLKDAWPISLLVLFSSIIISYLCLKFYDIPIRKWLTQRFISKLTK